MVNYSLKNEFVRDSENVFYTSYGIEAIDDLGNKVFLSDVFQNKNDAEKYIKLFNSEQLELIHLDQVIEDYLRFGVI